MFTIPTTDQKWFRSLLCCGLIAVTSSAAAAEIHKSPVPCADPVPIVVNETWRHPGGVAGEDHCYEIDVAERGILALDLSSPGHDPPRPVLALRPADGIAHVKRSAGSAVLAVRAGTYRFRVAAEDPRLALPPYKLRAGFVAGWGAALKDENDNEIDPDPDLLVSCSVAGAVLKDEDDNEIDPDPDLRATTSVAVLKDENDNEIDPDPDLSIYCGYDFSIASAMLRFKLGELCRRGEVDDHGDTFTCATPVHPDEAAVGEIANGWGDDEDLFRFRLGEPGTVEIASSGATDTFAELYDRFGNRLGRDDDGGEDGNFRLVWSLSPGVYFVRVAGRGAAAGPYSLAVETLY